MKKLIINISVVVISLTVLVSFSVNDNNLSTTTNELGDKTEKYSVPPSVMSILDKSCLPCHGADGNFKAKAKWNYDKMSGLKISKLVSKLSKISKKVEKGKMPTAKFVKKYPEKKLTDDEKVTLITWANNLVDVLSN